MARKKKTDRPGFLYRLLLRGAFILVVAGCVVSIVSTQSTIAEIRNDITALDEKIEIIEAQNQDYSDIVQSNDITRYMEKQAMENSGCSYAYPDERRYYDTSRDH